MERASSRYRIPCLSAGLKLEARHVRSTGRVTLRFGDDHELTLTKRGQRPRLLGHCDVSGGGWQPGGCVGRDNIIFGLVAEAPTVCPPNVLVYDPLRRDRVFEGDLTVRDAQPIPTSEEQCKHGGWAQFGFKNQGQCTRFVKLVPGPGAYPSSEAECRHGGWDLFGFTNERTSLGSSG